MSIQEVDNGANSVPKAVHTPFWDRFSETQASFGHYIQKQVTEATHLHASRDQHVKIAAKVMLLVAALISSSLLVSLHYLPAWVPFGIGLPVVLILSIVSNRLSAWVKEKRIPRKATEILHASLQTESPPLALGVDTLAPDPRLYADRIMERKALPSLEVFKRQYGASTLNQESQHTRPSAFIDSSFFLSKTIAYERVGMPGCYSQAWTAHRTSVEKANKALLARDWPAYEAAMGEIYQESLYHPIDTQSSATHIIERIGSLFYQLKEDTQLLEENQAAVQRLYDYYESAAREEARFMGVYGAIKAQIEEIKALRQEIEGLFRAEFVDQVEAILDLLRGVDRVTQGILALHRPQGELTESEKTTRQMAQKEAQYFVTYIQEKGIHLEAMPLLHALMTDPDHLPEDLFKDKPPEIKCKHLQKQIRSLVEKRARGLLRYIQKHAIHYKLLRGACVVQEGRKQCRLWESESPDKGPAKVRELLAAFDEKILSQEQLALLEEWIHTHETDKKTPIEQLKESFPSELYQWVERNYFYLPRSPESLLRRGRALLLAYGLEGEVFSEGQLGLLEEWMQNHGEERSTPIDQLRESFPLELYDWVERNPLYLSCSPENLFQWMQDVRRAPLSAKAAMEAVEISGAEAHESSEKYLLYMQRVEEFGNALEALRRMVEVTHGETMRAGYVVKTLAERIFSPKKAYPRPPYAVSIPVSTETAGVQKVLKETQRLDLKTQQLDDRLLTLHRVKQWLRALPILFLIELVGLLFPSSSAAAFVWGVTGVNVALVLASYLLLRYLKSQYRELQKVRLQNLSGELLPKGSGMNPALKQLEATSKRLNVEVSRNTYASVRTEKQLAPLSNADKVSGQAKQLLQDHLIIVKSALSKKPPAEERLKLESEIESIEQQIKPLEEVLPPPSPPGPLPEQEIKQQEALLEQKWDEHIALVKEKRRYEKDAARWDKLFNKHNELEALVVQEFYKQAQHLKCIADLITKFSGVQHEETRDYLMKAAQDFQYGYRQIPESSEVEEFGRMIDVVDKTFAVSETKTHLLNELEDVKKAIEKEVQAGRPYLQLMPEEVRQLLLQLELPEQPPIDENLQPEQPLLRREPEYTLFLQSLAPILTLPEHILRLYGGGAETVWRQWVHLKRLLIAIYGIDPSFRESDELSTLKSALSKNRPEEEKLQLESEIQNLEQQSERAQKLDSFNERLFTLETEIKTIEVECVRLREQQAEQKKTEQVIEDQKKVVENHKTPDNSAENDE